MTRRQAGDFSEARIADSRKSCDFSPSPKRYQPLPPSARMPLAPTKSAAGVSYSPSGGSGRQLQMLPYPPTNNPLQPTHGGLGRRAVTQLDFGRAQRSTANHFDRVMPVAQPRLMQQQQQHYHHGGSQYLYRRGNAAAAAAGGGGEGLFAGPYSSDSEFTAQRARRPHVLLHKEQPVLTRIRRPSQVRES